MDRRQIEDRIADSVFERLCDQLPHGIEYGESDEELDLIITGDGGKTEYRVEIEVHLTQVKPSGATDPLGR